jgi:hypothetical protein
MCPKPSYKWVMQELKGQGLHNISRFGMVNQYHGVFNSVATISVLAGENSYFMEGTYKIPM